MTSLTRNRGLHTGTSRAKFSLKNISIGVYSTAPPTAVEHRQGDGGENNLPASALNALVTG
jgi:hypothetical protein